MSASFFDDSCTSQEEKKRNGISYLLSFMLSYSYTYIWNPLMYVMMWYISLFFCDKCIIKYETSNVYFSRESSSSIFMYCKKNKWKESFENISIVNLVIFLSDLFSRIFLIISYCYLEYICLDFFKNFAK